MFIYRETPTKDRGRFAPPLNVKRLIGGLGWLGRLFLKNQREFECKFWPNKLEEAIAVEAYALSARTAADAAKALVKVAWELARQRRELDPTLTEKESAERLEPQVKKVLTALRKAVESLGEATKPKDIEKPAMQTLLDAVTAAVSGAISATQRLADNPGGESAQEAEDAAKDVKKKALDAEKETSKLDAEYARKRENAECTDEIYYLLSEHRNEAIDGFQKGLRGYAKSLAAERAHLCPDANATCPLSKPSQWLLPRTELGGTCLDLLKNHDKPEWPAKTWRCEFDPKRFGGDRHGEVGGLKPSNDLNLTGDLGQGNVLVLYDMDRGSLRENLRELPDADAFRWVLLDTIPPFKPMLDKLADLYPRYPGKLVGIVILDQIRELDVHISRGYSWERTVEELLEAIRVNSELAELFHRCKHLVIQIGFEGALHLINDGGKPGGRLYFDPSHLEGEFWKTAKDGFLPGTAECPLTAIAVQLARLPHDPATGEPTDKQIAEAIKRGIHRGLNAARWMLQVGQREEGNYLGRDAQYVSDYIFEHPQTSKNADRETTFGECEISALDPNLPGLWQIATKQGSLIDNLAMEVAVGGRSAIKDLPFLHIGKLDSVDRSEIQGLQILKTMFRQYLEQKDAKKPLSVAVFGEPGNGKSFAVRQIQEQFKEDCEFLEVNLSQLDINQGLAPPMHEVRGAVFRGKTPVVLWDEFDCDNWNWLKAFLAPMEDGFFIENQTRHPLGKCIFVFAGGLSHSFEKFQSLCVKAAGDPNSVDDFHKKKGPDFISRLSHVFNVMGPNRRANVMDINETDKQDICWPLRRALLLRSLLDCEEDKKLDIDHGLLRAIVLGPDYAFGKRSMRNLVDRLKSRAGSGRICRSMLPPTETLKLYVDPEKFTSKMKEAGPLA
jgi:hypothetical protein